MASWLALESRRCREPNDLPRGFSMDATSISLLDRLRDEPNDGSWSRLVELYSPLIRSWLGRNGLARGEHVVRCRRFHDRRGARCVSFHRALSVHETNRLF